MSVVNRDLQANHQIIMSLEQSKTQSERIIDTLSGLFLVFDRSMLIWKANLGLAAALCRDFESLTGSDLEGLFGDQELEIFRAKVDLFLKSVDRAPVEFELNARVKVNGVGIDRPFLWSLSEFKLPGRTGIELLQASAQDITEIKQAAQVFANLPLGLLMVDSTGIQPRFSAYTEVLLGRNDLREKRFREIFFPQGLGQLKPEEASAVEQLENIWGQDDLIFEMTRDQFPKIVLYEMPNGSVPPKRHLGVTLQAVVSKGVVRSLIVLLEDKSDLVTAREKEAAGRAAEELSIARIMQVKRVSPPVAQALFKDLNTSISSLRPALSGKDLRTIRAAIHSAKGNSRLAGMEILSRLCHETETRITDCTPAGQDPDWGRIAEGLDGIVAEWTEIHAIYIALRQAAPATTSPNNIAQVLVDRLEAAKASFSGSEMERYQIERLKLAVAAQNLTPLSDLQPILEHRVEKTAKELGVSATLETHWNGMRGDASMISVLSESMVHLINNSLVHGLAPQQGTPLQLAAPDIRIQITATQNEDALLCVFEDDGCGIQVEKVKAAALKMGLITLEKSLQMRREEVIQLVTQSGLSTSEKIDEVSGRGIGMDAVRLLVEKAGGQLDIASPPGSGARFTVILPKPPSVPVERKFTGFAQLIQSITSALGAASSDVPGFSANAASSPIEESDLRGVAFVEPRLLATAIATTLICWSRGAPIAVKLQKNEASNLLVLAAELTNPRSSTEPNELDQNHPEFSAALPECLDLLKQHGLTGHLPTTGESRVELALQILIEGKMLPRLRIDETSGSSDEVRNQLTKTAWTTAEKLGVKAHEEEGTPIVLSLAAGDTEESIRNSLLSKLEKRLFG